MVKENSVSGGVKVTLRIEALCILIAGVIVYQNYGDSWTKFAIFFFVPDISFIGYLAGPKAGSFLYNCAHSFIGPMLLLVIGLLCSSHLCLVMTMIWVCHIGFDRALGYGLKYVNGFSFTHLGQIGKVTKAE